MRTIRLALATGLGCAALVSCGQTEAPEIIVPAATEVVESPPPEIVEPSVAGWNMAEDGYPLLGTLVPGFSGTQHKGGRVTQDILRGRWTILVFWGLWSDDSIADAPYIRALVSAANQDPKLNFMSVHTPPGPERGDEALGAFLSIDEWFSDQGGRWPTIMDKQGAIAAALRVETAPFYLLVGPDLTIEAWRGALSETPDDGIKSVIRGVSEIKAQIASPQ